MKSRKTLSLFDGALIVVLLVVSFFGIFFMNRLIHGAGDSVVVEVGGELKGIYPLTEDRIVHVHGPLGDTRVEIKGGTVRVVDSPCPNKLCVRQGYISNGNIICIPNRVIVSISSGIQLSSHNITDIDAITQ